MFFFLFVENRSVFCILHVLAIELSKPRSTVIVFTDADAKDADRLQEVTDAAQAKNIPITSVLSSQCSSRKRRDILGKLKSILI